MPFAAVPFTNKPRRLSLRSRLEVDDIPTLRFINRMGEGTCSLNYLVFGDHQIYLYIVKSYILVY